MAAKKILLTLVLFTSFFGRISAQDLAVTGAPTVVSGCNLGSCVPITITIYNYGPFGIFVTPVDVLFSITGPISASVTESFTLTLPAGGVYTYTFFACGDFSQQGTYIVDFDVNMVGDLNTTNDQFSLTIVNDTTVVGGSVLVSDTVCASGNAGILSLVGNTGYIDYWQYSTLAAGGPYTPLPADSNSTLPYTNLTTTTYYQVVIDGGFCPDGLSPVAVITVDDTTDAGITIGNATVCATGNSGTVNLTGFTGTILDWTISTNGGATWSSTGNSSSSISYTNLGTSTLYHAIVANGVCPMDSSNNVTITVTMPPVPGAVSADATVCFGTNSDSLFLLGFTGTITSWISTTTGGAPYTNILNPTFIQPYSGLTTTTTYCAILQNGVCPADTSLCATITIAPPPIANAGLDTTIFLGDTICLNGSGGVFYNWTPASSPLTLVGANTSSPCVFGADSAGTFTYTLTVTDAFGCTDVDFVIVKVDDTASTPPSTNPILIICNFVTPNGDGNNDVWNIYDQNSTQTLTDIYPNNEVTVLNNHGQILYSKTGYTNDWKADGLTDGSYYYIVKINDIDKTYKGVLTVASSK